MISKEKKANNNTSESISDDIRSIKEDGAHIAETIAEEGKSKYDQIKSYSSRYIKKLEKEVAEKPVQSMALAMGAGIALGILLRRR